MLEFKNYLLTFLSNEYAELFIVFLLFALFLFFLRIFTIRK